MEFFSKRKYEFFDMEKEQKLKVLFEKMQADETLPLREANLVFGEGNVDCAVMFIGEAPGQKEDELIRPFVGRAGQLLTKMIEEIGWKREDVYITNIVKRRPPMNRDPLPEEIEAYKPYLTEQIRIIRPLVIATLGRFSMNYFLPSAKITRDQGKVFRMGSAFLVPLLHPAAALRGNEMMKLFRESFRKLPRIIEKCDELRSTPTSGNGGETDSESNEEQAHLL